MNEKLIEKKLREAVKAMGGIALKFSSPYHRGMPDRFILMPKGRIFFAELKSTGVKPTPLQIKAHETLRDLGFTVDVIDNQESLNLFIEKLK